YKNVIYFRVLGLCNNFAYVIMLSAAHDILDEEQKTSNGTQGSNKDTTYLSCNQIGTGAILLADILPTLVIKTAGPLYIQKIGYKIKVSLTVLFALASFFIVGFAQDVWLSILGVICASISGGLGEITFLSLSSFFDRNVVSTWSSGTGGAGVFGSLAYAGFTSAGLKPRTTVLIMVVVPVLMAISYFIVLVHPPELRHQEKGEESEHILKDHSKFNFYEFAVVLLCSKVKNKQELKTMQRPLLKYMIPLTTVYFAEYFINQGLHELLYFNNIWIEKKEQYRWYQVDYQIGVFLSRSSVNLLQIKKLWILPLLQLVNMAVLLSQVFYRYIPNVWIIFAIVLFEGLLGGAAYVNTFYRMSIEIPAEHREFSLGAASLGDTIGIAVAGAVAIPSHNHMCSLKIKMNS
ncbi:hypothetical protein LOTGIDRAFT_113507, partial [Lottia gigantea]